MTPPDVLPSILKRVGFQSLDEMYAAIGYGGCTALKAVNRIRDELLQISRVAAVDGRGPGGQVDNVPPGGEDEHLVGEHVDLQGVDELLRVRVHLVFQQPPDPLVGPLAPLPLDALLVLPVGPGSRSWASPTPRSTAG